MLAVLGVMAVSGIIAVTTTALSLHALGFTTSTRAGVQAQAAAEAGIDYAAAQLATLSCQSQYSSSSAPIFTVTVSYSTLLTSPGDVDTSWNTGCPTTTSAQRVKLVSTGTASALGVAGNSSGDHRVVEAIYPYTPNSSPYTIIPSGAALYAFAQADPTINNLTITQASTTRAIIEYLSGSATCTSGSTIAGDVILGSGGLSVTSGCTINGDLWAANTVNIQSGEVTGNLHVAGDGGGGYSVSLSNSSTVDGDVYSGGPGSFGGLIGGDVVAGPRSGLSTFNNQASVGGSVVSAGTISAPVGAIKGTISQNQSGIVTPIVPTVPRWIDYAYSPGDWQTSAPTTCTSTSISAWDLTCNAGFYALLTMKVCDTSTLASALITAQNSTVPMILDTRICGPITSLGGYNLTLKSNLVIVASGFSLKSNAITSSDSTDKSFWMITPDGNLNRTPDCPSNSSATIGNSVTVGSHVGAMIYTPCIISNSGDVWRGQMYASSINTSSSFTLNFLPLGLPTVNLSTGEYLPPAGTGVLGSRTSIRDLAVN